MKEEPKILEGVTATEPGRWIRLKGENVVHSHYAKDGQCGACKHWTPVKGPWAHTGQGNCSNPDGAYTTAYLGWGRACQCWEKGGDFAGIIDPYRGWI